MTMPDLRRFLDNYKWLIALVLAALAAAYLRYGGQFFVDVCAKLGDKDWWVDNFLTFLIFTGLVGWIVALNQRGRERSHRARFEGWTLIIKQGKDSPPTTQALFWEEVERFLASAFERWKFVKSLSSGAYWVTLPTIDEAQKANWIVISEAGRSITVDFGLAVEKGHATKSDLRARPA